MSSAKRPAAVVSLLDDSDDEDDVQLRLSKQRTAERRAQRRRSSSDPGAASSSSGAASWRRPAATITCPICFDEIFTVVDETIQNASINAAHKLPCGHQFCRNCIKDHLVSLVSDPLRFEKLICPQHGCEHELSERDLEKFCEHATVL